MYFLHYSEASRLKGSMQMQGFDSLSAAARCGKVDQVRVAPRGIVLFDCLA